MQLVFQTPLDTPPGTRMLYSDLNFILMAQVVQRISGQRIDAYAHDHVFGPLKMDDTQYLPAASLLRASPRPKWIHGAVGRFRGEVHDENAAILGGVSGHAGCSRPRTTWRVSARPT